MRYPLGPMPPVPVAPHQGGFGAVRRDDYHTGVDLEVCPMTTAREPDTALAALKTGKILLTHATPNTGGAVDHLIVPEV